MSPRPNMMNRYRGGLGQTPPAAPQPPQAAPPAAAPLQTLQAAPGTTQGSSGGNMAETVASRPPDGPTPQTQPQQLPQFFGGGRQISYPEKGPASDGAAETRNSQSAAQQAGDTPKPDGDPNTPWAQQQTMDAQKQGMRRPLAGQQKL